MVAARGAASATPLGACQLQALREGRPVPNSSPPREGEEELSLQRDSGRGKTLPWLEGAERPEPDGSGEPSRPTSELRRVFGAGLARSRWLTAGP